ncbi:MAG TPA: glycerophosphodiester phosphodiesterase family protein [Pirellulaceae bacterium]|nr:glycerophosphodiester phosphodiesterase family protein [Pirellulaceae bacterium]
MEPTPALKLVNEKKVLIIAHRGDSRVCPENTLPAFGSAVKVGADLVELDYFHSVDGVPIVSHDEILSRTTDADALFHSDEPLIGDYKAAELAQLDAGAWFDLKFAGTRLPTLAQALDEIQKGSVTLIERKGGDAATCVQLLAEKNLLDHVVAMSFDWDYVSQCRKLAPNLVVAALGSKPLNEKRLELAAATGAQIIVWNQIVIGRAEIAAIHARGLKAWVYTVDDPARAKALISAGIDGIITNVPGEMIRVRNQEFEMRSVERPAGQ